MTVNKKTDTFQYPFQFVEKVRVAPLVRGAGERSETEG